MIKSIVTAIVAIVITTSSASACGFLCKLAYGGKTPEVWAEEKKQSAWDKIGNDPKQYGTVEGNYIFVQNGQFEGADGITMIPMNQIAGKTDWAIEEVITEAVIADIADKVVAGEIELNGIKNGMTAGSERTWVKAQVKEMLQTAQMQESLKQVKEQAKEITKEIQEKVESGEITQDQADAAKQAMCAAGPCS